MIVGMHDNRVWPRQMRMVLEAGPRLEAYVYLYAGSADRQVEEAIDQLEREDLKRGVSRLWLDAETGFEMDGALEVDAIRRLYERCRERGLESGLYTGRWWWQPNTGDSAALADVPLWYASYDGRPEDTWRQDRFGGWQTFHTKQYMGSNSWCGVHCDRDFRRVAETPTVPAPVVDRSAHDRLDFAWAFESAIASLRLGLFNTGNGPADRALALRALQTLVNQYNLDGARPPLRLLEGAD